MSSKVKFPQRQEDGSFVVWVLFQSEEHLDNREIESWLQDWCTKNHTWVRNWHSGPERAIVATDELKLLEAFSRCPFLYSFEHNMLTIQLNGTPESPFWRDWYAKLSTEIVKRFPSLSFSGIKQPQ